MVYICALCLDNQELEDGIYGVFTKMLISQCTITPLRSQKEKNPVYSCPYLHSILCVKHFLFFPVIHVNNFTSKGVAGPSWLATVEEGSSIFSEGALWLAPLPHSSQLPCKLQGRRNKN